MEEMDVRISDNGRMVLPRKVREALGLHGDTKLLLTLEDDSVRLTPIQSGVRAAQAMYRRHATQAHSVDDFLQERRREAVADGDESSDSSGPDRDDSSVHDTRS